MIDFGEGVALAPLDPHMNTLYRTWRNDPRVRGWCRQTGLISALDQAAWMQRQNDDPSIRMFQIEGEKQVLGVCGLTSVDPVNRRAEFSLYIKPDAHGAGYGHKSLKTLLKFGFLDLGLNIIWGESFEGNPAIEMFRRLGFKSEGTRRDFYFKNGKFLNAHLFSIKRDEIL